MGINPPGPWADFDDPHVLDLKILSSGNLMRSIVAEWFKAIDWKCEGQGFESWH